MTRDLNKLHPYVKYLAEKLIEDSKKQGISIIITSTLRTMEEQDALYAQGRTKPGSIVTNCKAGQSPHNFGVAFDIAVVKNGKVDWNDDAAYRKIGALGQTLGMTWGGSFKKLYDSPHFEWTGGLTLKDLQSGKLPPNPLEKKEIALQDAIALWSKTLLNGKPVIGSPGDMLQEFKTGNITPSRLNAFLIKAANYIDKDIKSIKDAVYAWVKVGVVGSPSDMLKEFERGNLTPSRFEAFLIKSAKYIQK